MILAIAAVMLIVVLIGVIISLQITNDRLRDDARRINQQNLHLSIDKSYHEMNVRAISALAQENEDMAMWLMAKCMEEG